MSKELMTTNNNTYGIEPATWSVLKNTVYPGAKDESIKMIWDYSIAGNFDPLQKFAHIVPMSVKDSKTGNYEWRDVVMPGIGLYRIQATRTKQYAGVTEPEFGPLITTKLGGVEITYPEWCKITVKKIMNGFVAEFTAKELWIENYANAGKDKITKQINMAANSMWQKRPFGQLAKCAEAQALRKAFPDVVSQQPTAEEMEGKGEDVYDAKMKNITPRSNDLSAHLTKLTTAPLPVPETRSMEDNSETKEYKELCDLIRLWNVNEDDILFQRARTKEGVSDLSELSLESIQKCIDYIRGKYIRSEDSVVESNEATSAISE